jgi:hypothetical protein
MKANSYCGITRFSKFLQRRSSKINRTRILGQNLRCSLSPVSLGTTLPTTSQLFGNSQDGSFPLTRHSVVLAAQSHDPAERSRAIEAIAAAYWKPVYRTVANCIRGQ